MHRIGIDLVEISDIKARLSESFTDRLLSPKERIQLTKLTHPERKLQFIAGRFAAKEAYAKAYGRFETPLNFQDISIVYDPQGAPLIQTPYRSQDVVHLSISHTTHYAVAMVMIDMIE